MAAIEQDEVWRDFFFTELTTGLRRGEICGLRWEDFDEAEGTLKVNRSVSTRKAGSLEVGETKTNKGHRSISLPDSTAQRLRERKKTAISDWIFPQSLASGGSSQSWLCLQSDENDPEKYRPTKY